MSTRQTFRITLAGEPGAVLRCLRATLKRLGRVFGVRCVGIEEITAADAESNFARQPFHEKPRSDL